MKMDRIASGKAGGMAPLLDWDSQTVFKDAVLGYINIPKAMVKELIDHEIFQRLRDVAQTGMETLYPGATHNRFCHSIGVYHLGKLAFQCFQQNVRNQHGDDIYYQVAEKPACERVWNRWRFLFECACLLHDCGHSPLSHSLEFLYDSIEVNQDGIWKPYGSDKILLDDFRSSDDFRERFYKAEGRNPGNAYGGQHERMSAHLIAHPDGYRDHVEKLVKDQMLHFDSSEEGRKAVENYDDAQLQSDLEFMARMIIGYPYSEQAVFLGEERTAPDTKKIIYQLRNCIIRLLNGIVDVDNIDYSVRDATASGYKSAQVDYERLLKAETIALAYEHEAGLELAGERFDYSVRLKNFLSDKVTDDSFPLRLTISGSATLLVRQDPAGESKQNAKFAITGDIIEDDERSVDKEDVRVIHIRDGSNAHITISKGQLEIRPRSGSEELGTQLYIRSDALRGTIRGTIFTGSRFAPDMKEAERLLRERICRGTLRVHPAYHKSALSVIQGALDATNFESRWIYSHHVTTYNNNFLSVFLLEKYAEYLFQKEFSGLIGQLNCFLDIYKKFLDRKGELHVDTLENLLKKADNKLTDIKNSFSELSEVTLPQSLPAFGPDGRPEIFQILLEILCVMHRIIPVGEGVKDQRPPFCDAVIKLTDAVNGLTSAEPGPPPSNLETDVFQRTQKALRSYEGHRRGMYTMSAILGMPEPRRVNGQAFHRTSDADLRSAYHSLNKNATKEEKARYRDLFDAIEQYESRRYLTPMWKSHAEFHFYTQGWKKDWFYPRKKNSKKGKNEEGPSLIEEFFSESTIPYDPKDPTYKRPLYVYFSDEAVRPYDEELRKFWDSVKKNFPLKILVYVPQKIRHKKLSGDETYVVWKDRVVTMKDIGLRVDQGGGESYFYLYYRLDAQGGKNFSVYDFMDFMKKQLENKDKKNTKDTEGMKNTKDKKNKATAGTLGSRGADDAHTPN